MAMVHHDKTHLRTWPAAYYLPLGKNWISSKKWQSGQLFLDYSGLTFYADTDKDSPQCVLYFSDITGMRKASTVLIYSALVISIKEKTYWFSSLANRDAVYVIIEHFWRECLIPDKVPLVTSSERTKLGTELLTVAGESQNTLKSAGTALHHQGLQLDRAIGVVFDVQSDLKVAEKLLSGFDSWIGNWRLPEHHFNNEPIEVLDHGSIPTICDFPVLYSRWSNGAGDIFKNGTLCISSDGILILDQNQIDNVHFYKRLDISTIRVKTPWELTISQYIIGQPDISFHLMSTHMVRLLRVLEVLYKNKIDYLEPPQEVQLWPRLEPDEAATRNDAVNVLPLDLTTDLLIPQRAASTVSDARQTQLLTPKGAAEVVSEAEVKELLEMVGCMKNMAVDIGMEQASQLQKIDSLTSTVESTNDRIRTDTTRIKRLF